MPALNNQPDNLNFLSPLGFRFFLKRSPHLNFFLTEASVPGLSINIANVNTPFQTLYTPGSGVINYSDLDITFKVDEDMRNYQEMYDWIVANAAPKTMSQHSVVRSVSAVSGAGVHSDGTLTILNSAYRPSVEYQFERLFPTSLSELKFSISENDINYITATVSFKFEIMSINRLI